MSSSNNALNSTKVSHLTVVPKFRYYDLKRMARTIAAAKGKSLKTTIDRHVFLRSCITDLKLAKALVNTLNQSIANELDSTNDGETPEQFALMFASVSLYARATKTASKRGARGSFDIRSSLDANQKKDHSQIVTIRDTAFAHLSLTHSIGQQTWNYDDLILIDIVKGWRVVTVAKRIYWYKDTLARLGEMLNVALAIIEKQSEKTSSDLIEMISSDPAMMVRLTDFAIDPLSVWRSQTLLLKTLDSIVDDNTPRELFWSEDGG